MRIGFCIRYIGTYHTPVSSLFRLHFPPLPFWDEYSRISRSRPEEPRSRHRRVREGGGHEPGGGGRERGPFLGREPGGERLPSNTSQVGNTAQRKREYQGREELFLLFVWLLRAVCEVQLSFYLCWR